VSRNAITITAAMALLLAGGSGGYDRYRPRRELTLDEEEAESARRMLNQARARARQTAREHARVVAQMAAEEAARKEAARPKSRQELRFAARKRAKRLREDRCFQKGERRP
jgi:hypothetical protein